MHPAQTLAPGDVRGEIGFASTIAVGDLSSAVAAAENDQASNGGAPATPGSDPTFAKGAIVLASAAPGLSPMAGARVGVGWQSEAGLVYTGRAVRVDMRRSFDLSEHWALSAGVAGSSVLYGRQNGGVLADVSLGQIHGWGADVPLLVGYRSDGGLYMLWAGARGGWEGVDVSDVTSEPKAVTLGYPPASLSATRFWGGVLAGLAVGFRHVHVAMEIDASYQTIEGSYNQRSVTVGGLSLAPATALWWDF